MYLESVESEHYRALEKTYNIMHVVGGRAHGLDGQIDDVGAGGCKLHEEKENKSNINSPRLGGRARLMNSCKRKNLQM